MDFTVKDHYSYEDLLALTRLLRAPDGCPWDSVQTHASIRRNFIEEVYEACEAIDQDDPIHLCEELGDVLYQVLFHADLEREAGRFSVEDVIDGVCKKLVARHPFLFADEHAADAEDALDRWDNVKRSLNGYRTHAQAMDNVSRTLPALWRAEKLLGKARKAGLERASALEAVEAMQAQLDALRIAIAQGSDPSDSLGDALFAGADVARKLGIDPEDALNNALERFIDRFDRMEQAAAAEGRTELPPEALAACFETTKE
ncbi:MAG: nucleoside triphosphate pyrophosphohydrolase [Desulfovibrio sp.]|nr:nucleoside triphosphate pyrophosphohydrolase [Desulfovibrio sp.]